MSLPDPTKPVPREFILRMNDFLDMANRIERRHDSAHAQMVLLHTFAWYGAHHYFKAVPADKDTASEREDYGKYLSQAIVGLVTSNLDKMRGPPRAADASAPDAGAAEAGAADAGEPAAE